VRKSVPQVDCRGRKACCGIRLNCIRLISYGNNAATSIYLFLLAPTRVAWVQSLLLLPWGRVAFVGTTPP